MILTKKCKIKLDFNQQLIVETLSNEHRKLYNYLLDKTKKTCDFKVLNECYKNYRHQYMLTINSKSAQNTCNNLINNIKSFYELKKKDKTAEFPYKFKGHQFFCSFMYDCNGGNGGFKIEDNVLTINLLSKAKNAKKLIINLPPWCDGINTSTVKTMTFTKEEGKYYICFTYEHIPSPVEVGNNFIAIDLGYSNLVSGVTNVGENVLVQNYRQKDLDKVVRELTGKRDKRVKGSRRYKKYNKALKRKRIKKTNRQIDFQHKASKVVVDYCLEKGIGRVIVGNLKVKKVIENKKKKEKKLKKEGKVIEKVIEKVGEEKEKENELNGLSKSSGVGRFKTFLAYKVKKAGLDYCLVNEYNTSKMNCLTGKLEFDSSMDKRFYEWKGIRINRDFNSGINFLPKAGVWLAQDEKIHLLNNSVKTLSCLNKINRKFL